MEFTSANVERVVKEFYSTGGGAPANNDWLNRAQSSAEAWTFAWDLLTPDKPAEVQFFGANTLASKVSKCFHEVNQQDFPMLRQRLVQLFRTYSNGGLKVVLVRLGVALASLMIHSMPHLWQDPVGDQVEQLRKDLEGGGMAMLPGFLELLTVLPEEFATQVMPAQRKGVVRARLAENLPQVLQLIVQLLQQESSVPKECMRLAARSLQGWVQFGIPVDVTERLVELILPKVADEELAEDYLDVITSIVSHPETHDHPEAMKRIISRLVVLEQLLAKYMAEENFDSALPLASLLIAIGENHSRLLLDWTVQGEEGKATATKLVSLILQVSSCPTQYPTNERLSEMAFGFWYIFQDDIIACDPPQFQTCVAVYGQAFHALVEALLKKSMLPLTYDGWSSDEREAFRCYRTDVADTIMYCYNILKDDLLKLLNHHLDEGIRLCQGQGQQARQWPYMETCLYAWSAIGASLAEEEENYLVIQFLAKLPSIPCKSDANVISTTLDCIGGFAEWLDGYPNLVANLVPLVTSSIGNPELALAATMALKDLSRDCTEALQPCSRDIIGACGAALSSGRLKPSECARLMFPVGRMVAYLPRGDMLNEMQGILTPYLTELQNIAAKQQSASVADKNQVIYALKIVTTLFQSLDGSGPMAASRQNPNSQQQGQQKEPMAILLPQIFPLVANVSRNWLGDEEVMDLVYTFMKQTLICLVGTKLLLMETVEYLHSSYSQYPHPCAFDVTSQLFLQYGNDQASSQVLVQMMSAVATKTMQSVQKASNASVFSELMATAFQNFTQLLKKHPAFFSLPGQGGVDVQGLFSCACFCIRLPEAGAVKYAASYLTHLVSASASQPGSSNPALAATVRGAGSTMVREALSVAVASSPSSDTVEQMSMVFFYLSKYYFEELCRWLEEVVKQQGFPGPAITEDKKREFASNLVQSRGNKRKVLDSLKDFVATCISIQGRK